MHIHDTPWLSSYSYAVDICLVGSRSSRLKAYMDLFKRITTCLRVVQMACSGIYFILNGHLIQVYYSAERSAPVSATIALILTALALCLLPGLIIIPATSSSTCTDRHLRAAVVTEDFLFIIWCTVLALMVQFSVTYCPTHGCSIPVIMDVLCTIIWSVVDLKLES